MKKVLFISYTNIFGGAEYVLCDYLRNNNYHDYYIYTTNKEEVILEYKKILSNKNIYTSNKMNIVSIRKSFFVAIKNIMYNLIVIHKIVKKNNIDMLYGNNTLDVLLLVLYKKLINKNIKIISHIHDIIEKNYIKIFIEKNNKYIDQFIVPSVATQKSLINCKVNLKNISVVYNGINVNEKDVYINFNNEIKKRYNIDKNKIIYCFIGQICKRKRVDLFINIINKLNKIENKYIGLIIGEISDEKYYNQIKNQMKDFIIYLGKMKRKNIFYEIYPQIDALILTSDRDPLPTVILEAMSMGAIVISRDVDGVKEIVLDKKDGFIFPYNMDIEDITHLIRNIEKLSIEEKIKIKEMAKLKVREKFNVENKIRKINRLIENL